jgi:bacteriorhodopsin
MNNKEVQNKCERKYKVEAQKKYKSHPAKKLHTYRHAYWARKPDWAVNWPVS